jgi:hypothetical protein
VDDGHWVQVAYDISEVADNQPAVYIRWLMGPTDDSYTYCGWNIDDIEIWALRGGPPQTLTTALVSSGPNPLEPKQGEMNVVFDQAADGPARLSVYDLRGRLVRAVQADFTAGQGHVLNWNGLDRADRQAPSGVYVYRLKVNGKEFRGKLALVR